ncbi:MAG: hypothetical protein Ct9H90mP13_12400 [Pseudomonadota bacterium]|nr:MAG: hypothetical protein Ct9H90mP13_12400 [Pseudomonadota bacterium]
MRPRKYGVDLKNLFGAAHAFEIPFVWVILMKMPYEIYTSRKNLEEVKTLSQSMMSYWAEFVYNGDPDKGREGNLTFGQAWDPRKGKTRSILYSTPLMMGG